MGGRLLARRILFVVACLMGAAGVAAAAAAAHVVGGGPMNAAALILLAHAPAILALGAVAGHTAIGLAAMAVLAAGSLVFAGDMAMRAWFGTALLPMAAPVAGSAIILAWIAAALAVTRAR